MADEKQCSYVLPHEFHGWEEQGVGPFGHRQYHVCSGVKGDPYADCECGHGRHTHVRYVYGCGLCDCPAVRPASPLEGQEERS